MPHRVATTNQRGLMRKLQVIASGLLALTLVGAVYTAPASAVTPPPWCRSTTDDVAQRFLGQMLELATSDETGWARSREALDSMPKADSSQVWLVTDDSLCHLASEAADSSLYKAPRGYAVHLAHVGTRYVAFPPSDSSWHAGYLVHMDSTFSVIAVSAY
jgi:hypothetical protein